MILHCQECGTHYSVRDGDIAPPGRLVRCARCAYSWFEPFPKEADDPAIEAQDSRHAPPLAAPLPPAPSEPALTVASRPAIEEPAAFPGDAALLTPDALPPRARLNRLCVALALSIFFLAPLAYRHVILTQQPGSAALYAPLGITSLHGLALTDIALAKTPLEQNMLHVTISCSVVNTAKTERILPNVVVTVQGANDRMLGKEAVLLASGGTLAPGAKAPCAPFSLKVRDGAGLRARLDLRDGFDAHMKWLF